MTGKTPVASVLWIVFVVINVKRGLLMNDFKKEELQFIYRSLEQLKWYKSSYIMKKIQSLIDNYCEHGYMTGKSGVITCDDCGAIL